MTSVQQDFNIERSPIFGDERLRFVCKDPFDTGVFVFSFSDHTALVVSLCGNRSRWAEEQWELAHLLRGPRCAWTWVPAGVRVEAWRRALELDDLLTAR